ncbi:MAG: NAD(P)-dependent oxidoreductase [Candidatus Poribacteria bacterium]|nr:NAD(P)-dependent oxidoreductase [Candidatus Poribacteria bacterium]
MGKKKVLITGAAGRIGRVLRDGLKDRYDLRLLYHRTVLPEEPGEEVYVASITDLPRMVEVTEGVDAIIHMAGEPSTQASFESVLEANIRGTYCIYEAARQTGVNRVVFASTNHVTGFYEQEGIYTTPEMPVRPDSYYGASKAFGESLGRYYVDAFGLEVICLRIGSFQPVDSVRQRTSDRILSTWLSHQDTVQLVWRSIEAESVRFGIYYGISNNTRAYWASRTRETNWATPQRITQRITLNRFIFRSTQPGKSIKIPVLSVLIRFDNCGPNQFWKMEGLDAH